MRIKNVQALLPDGSFALRDIEFTDKITALTEPEKAREGISGEGAILLPGLIDVHTHGACNGDFSDGKAEDLPKMTRYYASHGVTTVLGTTMTLPEEILCRAAAAMKSFAPQDNEAEIWGVHMEGPFLSYEKRGAQCAEYLCSPEEGFFDRVNYASGGKVKLIALAPELPGALPFIERVSKKCRVALGHTACNYGQAAAAFAAGATELTHLYNAMSPLHHRQPGPIAAGSDSGAYAELIADGYHVHPAMIRAAFKLFPQRVILISDSLRCAGMPKGDYELGGQKVTLATGVCTLKDSSTIAGSVITVYDGLVNAVRFGIPLRDAALAATAHPAQALSMKDRGFLAPGMQSDLLLLNKDLSIRKVFLRGRPLN